MSSSYIKLFETQDHNYAVNTGTGEAFMSRRALSRHLGVHHSTVNRVCATLYPNHDGALSDIQVSKCATQLLATGKVKNLEFVEALMAAGARAFIYSQAGYNPTPVRIDTKGITEALLGPDSPLVDIVERFAYIQKALELLRSVPDGRGVKKAREALMVDISLIANLFTPMEPIIPSDATPDDFQDCIESYARRVARGAVAYIHPGDIKKLH